MGLLNASPKPLVEGATTAAASRHYSLTYGARLDPGHYSDFRGGLKLSAIGVGTFPGVATDAVDEQVAAIVHDALVSGINVIDTAAHYRYGRSIAAVGAGLRRAWAAGVARDAVWIMSKGGFVQFDGGPPTDPDAFVRDTIIGHGLARPADCVPGHVLSPLYLRAQLEASRTALGIATLDAFLVDQPEVQMAAYGKERVLQRLGAVFEALEQAVVDGVLRFYGVSSFHAFRVPTDDPLFLSLPALVALAEKAATAVTGEGRGHHFALITLPFNAVMVEGFSRFNQVTGPESEASTFQAALQLGLYTVASHGLFKGHLARHTVDILTQAMPVLANDAQRALQFNRSTPGLGTTLVGLSTAAHLDDMLAVARVPVLAHAAYMKLYQRVED